MNSQFSDDAVSGALRPKNQPEYSAPKLIGYGALREITLAVGKNGNTDGGGTTSSNKTHA